MSEYNWGVNPALKNAVDYLNREWAYKAIATVSYGGWPPACEPPPP